MSKLLPHPSDIMPVFRFRTPYDGLSDKVSDETAIDCSPDTAVGQDVRQAVQSGKDEADINWIVSRYLKTGELPAATNAAHYGDFTGISDYHTALNSVIAADEAFMALPATLRARFENDPGQLLDFLADSKNRDEAVKLGLIHSPAVSSRAEGAVDNATASSDEVPATPPAKKGFRAKSASSDETDD